VLVGKEYWGGLLDWIKNTMLEKEQNIHQDDLNQFALVDTADEAISYIEEFYKSHELSLNF
jgi:predicted Rossmann-fold nucleotide-binding protein